MGTLIGGPLLQCTYVLKGDMQTCSFGLIDYIIVANENPDGSYSLSWEYVGENQMTADQQQSS